MEYHHLPLQTHADKVLKLNQAIFYCYNASSQRVAVGMVNNFTFPADNVLCFTTNYFPVTEMNWHSFAAELHFYKKDFPESFVLHGVAVIEHTHTNTVMFTICDAAFSGTEINSEKSLFSTIYKSYITLYRKSSELLMQPFKRKTETGIFQ